MSKITTPSLVDMLKAGLHFGHRTSRWHPKMREYIFGARKGMHIINLEETEKQLAAALEKISGIASRGGTILFVGTKKQAQPFVKKYAEACGMPYVTERWLGGTLTNFAQIKLILKRLKKLKDQREKGELRKYTKKEQIILGREIEEMEVKVGGIQNVERLPDAIFVVDVRHEKTAVLEAKVSNVLVIGLCDTNVNPTNVDVIIPGNDDAVKSIELITKTVSDAITEGKKQAARDAATKKVVKKEEVKKA